MAMKMARTKSAIDRWTTPPGLTPEAGLRFWQDRVMLVLLFMAVSLGFIGFVSSARFERAVALEALHKALSTATGLSGSSRNRKESHYFTPHSTP